MVNSSETYRKFAQYYDLYVGKYNADLDFYISLCKNVDSIIEVGCGTGRVMLPFLQNGFQITGIDISDEMLEIATHKLSQSRFPEKYKLMNYNLYLKPTERKYDKALVTFYTFNYIIQQPEIFLKNIYNSLTNNGMAVFDLFYPKSLIDKSSDNQWKEGELNIENRIIRIKDKRRFENNIEYRIQVYIENSQELQIETERKYYSPDEISSLLNNVGFKEICFSTHFDKNSFSGKIKEKNLKSNFIVKAQKMT
jgi:SAM-dependent methyltransferase